MGFTRSLLGASLLGAASVAVSGPLAAQETRIVGGAPILLDQAPSIVALLRSGTLESTGSALQAQFCAGTLISETFVITAAHCVVSRNNSVAAPGDQVVLPNTFDLNNPGANPVAVAEVIVHENYVSSANSFDIALLRLATPVNFPAIELIDPANELFTEEDVAIAGWGTRQFVQDPNALPGIGQSVNFPNALEGARVIAIETEVCNATPDLFPLLTGRIDETMVCAGLIEGGVDSCQGDSGGPLYRISDGNFVLAGITSWGIGCGLPSLPGVYSNVAFFNDWISQRVNSTAPPQEPELEPVIIATNDDNTIDVGDVPPLALSSSGGGGSFGGWLFGALALIGFSRKRFAKT